MKGATEGASGVQKQRGPRAETGKDKPLRRAGGQRLLALPAGTVPKNYLALGDKILRPGPATLATVKGWGCLIRNPPGKLQLQLLSVPRSSSFLHLQKVVPLLRPKAQGALVNADGPDTAYKMTL